MLVIDNISSAIRQVFAGLLVVGMTSLLVLSPVAMVEAANLLALLDTSELFESADGGATWTVRGSLPASDAVGIMAETDASRMFMITRSGVMYASIDAGSNWSSVGSVPASDVVDLAIRPSGDILVLTRAGTVWQSQDQGGSFVALSTLGASDAKALASANDGDLHAISEGGLIWRSNDGGLTWSVQAGIPAADVVTVRRAGTQLLAMTSTGIAYRSLDQGTTWSPIGTLSQVRVVGIASNGNEIAAATEEGLVGRSNDNGATWSWVGTVNQVKVVALSNDEAQAVDILGGGHPAQFYFAPPGPNPFRVVRDDLILRFGLSQNDRVTVRLYDVAGRHVLTRPNSSALGPGAHEMIWQIESLPNGIYFVTIQTKRGLVAAHRLTVIK
jgi:hypothetical protein